MTRFAIIENDSGGGLTSFPIRVTIAATSKRLTSHRPNWIDRVEVSKEGGSTEHVVCNNAATLVYLANRGIFAQLSKELTILRAIL